MINFTDYLYDVVSGVLTSTYYPSEEVFLEDIEKVAPLVRDGILLVFIPGDSTIETFTVGLSKADHEAIIYIIYSGLNDDTAFYTTLSTLQSTIRNSLAPSITHTSLDSVESRVKIKNALSYRRLIARGREVFS